MEYYQAKNTFYRSLNGESDLDATRDEERQYLLSVVTGATGNESTGSLMFRYLGQLGITTQTTLADRWYAFLLSKGYSGSLRDMQKQFFTGGSFT